MWHAIILSLNLKREDRYLKEIVPVIATVDAQTVVSSGSVGKITLSKRDIIELIKCDIVELSEGAFRVLLDSDDGGTLINVMLEDHSNTQEIMRELDRAYPGHRLVITKVPHGWLKVFRPLNSHRD